MGYAVYPMRVGRLVWQIARYKDLTKGHDMSVKTNGTTDLTADWTKALAVTIREYAAYCQDVHLNVHPVQAYDIFLRTHELLSHVDDYTLAYPPHGTGWDQWVKYFTNSRNRFTADAAHVHVAGYVLSEASTALQKIIDTY